MEGIGFLFYFLNSFVEEKDRRTWISETWRELDF